MDIKERVKLDKFTHSVRASQAVLQYGVGAMVDFPEQTLMTAAPETWESSVVKIHDERLENDILHVDYIGMPGSIDDPRYQNGISYTRFPEWYLCPKCRTFKPISEWLHDYSQSPRMRKRYDKDPNMVKKIYCTTCFQELIVARIIVACGQGHIDDFPWVKWVHAKNFGGAKKICSHPKLKFKTTASSTEGLEGLTITCENCHARTTLKGAFDQNALEELDNRTGGEYNFRCSGRHPWKNCKEACGVYPHVLQRGSSSVYFPISESSLVIPPYSSRLTKLIENSQGYSDYRKAIRDSLNTFRQLKLEISHEQVDAVVNSKIEEYSPIIANEIGKSRKIVQPVLERNKNWNQNRNIDISTKSVKYKAEEYVALNGEVVSDEIDGDFVREATEIKDYNLPFVKNISLIHKIREVQALIGYSRLEPIEKGVENGHQKVKLVDIKQKETNWYPGYEVRGEGIFIEFEEDAINSWRSRNSELNRRVQILNENYAKSFYGVRKPRVITSKFLLLHTISHILMKQLSFECGYNIASIKERIYCSEPSEGRTMSGILLYTASGDSEGTMGGLVRQGRPDVFPKLFKKAIDNALTCSNDPVCGLSQGQGRDSLNLAACYSCALVPETSCEEFNVFLDRGVVVGTYENSSIGFYSHFINNWISEPIMHVGDETETVKNNEKNNVEIVNNTIIIKDFGVVGSTHKSVWENLVQFAENSEKEKIEELLENISEFDSLERPGYDGTFTTLDSMEDYGVDLIWKKSKVMVFSNDNREEYELAKGKDWKCYFINSTDFQWRMLLEDLKEE